MSKFLRGAIALTIGFGAWLSTVAPVGAATLPANVRVNSHGDLVVVARQDNIDIGINGTGTGTYAVRVTEFSGAVTITSITGVTRDVRVDTGTRMGVAIDVGSSTPTSIPADLRVKGRPATGRVNFQAQNLTVGDDVIIDGAVSADLYGVTVTDDVRLHARHGHGSLQLADSTAVGDLVYARTFDKASSIGLEITRSAVGRVLAIGGGLTDFVELRESLVDETAKSYLKGGSDRMTVDTSAWSDTLVFHGGSGADEFSLDGPSAAPVSVRMHGGKDAAYFLSGLYQEGSGSTIDGGGGRDVLGLDPQATSRATVVNFEVFPNL